jgi:VIT1/CCC1 family predicted Fe2+/Mn2+ transporter
MEKMSDAKSIMELQSVITGRRETMSDNQYIINVVIMSIFWTVSSFSFYLLLFMTKYYEGSIYINFYLDGIAGLLGSTLSLISYNFLKTRWSYAISLSLTLIFVILVMIYQQDFASPHFVESLLPADKKSPFEEDSEEDR